MFSASLIMKSSCVFVLVVIGMVGGQMTKLGKCPDTEMMKGFEMSMLSGVWHVVMKNPDFSDLFVRCMNMNFHLIKPDSFEVEATGLDMAGNKYTNVGTVTLDDATNSLKIVVPSIAFTSNYKVIHVNSKTLSIGYNCVQAGELHSQYVWIFARSPRISANTADVIKNFVQRRGIDITKLNVVANSCPVSA